MDDEHALWVMAVEMLLREDLSEKESSWRSVEHECTYFSQLPEARDLTLWRLLRAYFSAIEASHVPSLSELEDAIRAL